MFLPLHIGGQGIVHLLSQLLDFRFQFVYRLIQSVELEEIHPSVFFSRYYRSDWKLGYGNHLFLLENIPVCNSLPTYYRDCLRAWKACSVVRQDSPTSVADVLDEPMFKGKAVLHPLTGEPLFLENVVVAGVTQIRHLIDVNERRRLTVVDLQGLFPWRCSKRFLQRMLDLVWAAIPKSYLDILEPFLHGQHAVGNRHANVFSLSVPGIIPKVEFYMNCSPKRRIYSMSVLQVASPTRDSGAAVSPWLEILGVQVSSEKLFGQIYRKPHAMREGDLSWRFLHGALSTGSFFCRAGFQDNDLCAHCGEREDLEHMFLYCSRLSNLLELVRDVMAGVLDTASVTTEMYVLGPWMGGFSTVSWPVHLATWIATQAKLATFVIIQNLLSGDGSTNACRTFVSRVRARISVEFDFRRLQNNFGVFSDTWCTNDMLCSVHQNELTLHV
jgi:hypothetical protein